MNESARQVHEGEYVASSLRKMRTSVSTLPDVEKVFAQAGATPWEAALDVHEKRQITARIKQAREEAGLSQERMADELGMSLRGYVHYESQTKPRVPFDRLEDIARFTRTSRDWLLYGNGVPSEDETLRQLAREMGAMRALLERIAERLEL